MYNVGDLSTITGFEWDKWNSSKIFEKHRITTIEAEEPFEDENQLVLEDIKHSQKEIRFNLIGKTTLNKVLFLTFTLRDTKVRIISARRANTKERKIYEKI